jgi:hypothetical protein
VRASSAADGSNFATPCCLSLNGRVGAAVAGVATMLPRRALDQVVGEYAVFGSDSRTVDAREFGAVPAVAAFDVVDPAFGTDAPINRLADARSSARGVRRKRDPRTRGLRAIRR